MNAKGQKRNSVKNRPGSKTRKRNQQETTNIRDFPVVGIGASAGGLEAFKSLLKNLPPETGMAFILIQHLDPTHPSSLPRLLSSVTKMPVMEARNGMDVDPDSVYVMPTNASMTMENHRIRITVRASGEMHLPIDALFTSLAEQKKGKAIGVVLSGTGSDGTVGLSAIKSEGGVTFAQDPASAKYPSMPRSADESGSVDFVLPPERIASELARLGDHQSRALLLKQPSKDGLDQFIKEIQKILQESTGVDFTNYKPTTIERRIHKRLMLNKLHQYHDYVKLLRQKRQEVESLYHDIFIHVTSFFRDPEKYEVLKSKVFPQLLKNSKPEDSLRVWVAGCSSGEEVYSLAIALLEFLESTRTKRHIRIFATDISESEIQKARSGIYPSAIKKDVSLQRLKKFFDKRDNGYQIIKRIREICVFAKHDLTAEPPFSHMDLISCCNLLIYLTDTPQKRVLTNFHYSLKPSGILLLGKSESTNSVPNLFEVLDKTFKVYSKRMVPTIRVPFQIPVDREKFHKPDHVTPVMDWEREADRLVLDKLQHAGFLIDANMQILAFRGAVAPFLDPARGQASLELTKMVRKGLRNDLRMVHYKVKRKMTPARKEGVTVQMDGKSQFINIEEVPIRDPASDQIVFLVMLEDAGNEENRNPTYKRRKISENKDRTILNLERQLGDLKEDMTTGVEDQNRLTEELTTTNEELQSANEELQSSNEELESAKEQLESTNEELSTLNEELQTRNREMDQTNADLKETRDLAQAIVETVLHPLITLDRNLRVKEANHAFYETFRLSSKKVEGEFFLDIDEKAWDIPELMKGLRSVFDRNMELKRFSVEHDFPRLGTRIMLLNARRIVQQNGEQDFALLAMQDITDSKRVEEASATLIKDIHHRVKNNLQVITSLLGLQGRFVHDADSAVAAFHESANRVRSMALIHEKLYESQETGKLDFSEYLKDLVRVLFDFYNVLPNTTRLKMDVEKIYLDMDQAIPCGLIVNELLSNTLKHAFPESKDGEIHIRMERVPGRGNKPATYILSVSDNGIGLPSAIDPQNPQSLGLKIVRSLVGQLKGSFKVDRGRETIFSITFQGSARRS